MSKRLQMLEKLVRSGQADAFAWYGLALEYRREKRSDEALETFSELRAKFPEYLPMFLMCGQLLLAQERKTEAAEWLKRGIELAEAQGNGQAQSELEEALEECE